MHGWYKTALIKFLENNIFLSINRDSLALDIGANIGNHTNYFDSIHAFEPNERTYRLLQANAMLAPGKIVCHNVAVRTEAFPRPSIFYPLMLVRQIWTSILRCIMRKSAS